MKAKAENGNGCLGLMLYVVTFLLDLVIAGPARFVLGYVLFVVLSLFVGLPLSVVSLSVVVALLPSAYSLLGLVFPLSGQCWRLWVGAREPTGEELQRLKDAMAMLASYSPVELPPLECYVIDLPFPLAFTRGRATIVSRVLVYEDGLAAKLAHEYGHVLTWDGRLTEALHRLDLWSDPLYGGTDSAAEETGGPAARNERGAWIFGLIRLVVWLAGGALGRFLLRRSWSWYWRLREFAADARAASLGQREDLRRHLEEKELLLDGPQEWFKQGRYEHPPIAERVDRLRVIAGSGS